MSQMACASTLVIVTESRHVGAMYKADQLEHPYIEETNPKT